MLNLYILEAASSDCCQGLVDRLNFTPLKNPELTHGEITKPITNCHPVHDGLFAVGGGVEPPRGR
jgi:hypothetical protein